MTTTLLQKEYMMQNRLNWLDSMKALGVFMESLDITFHQIMNSFMYFLFSYSL